MKCLTYYAESPIKFTMTLPLALWKTSKIKGKKEKQIQVRGQVNKRKTIAIQRHEEVQKK